VHPAMSAAAVFWTTSELGAFQGTMAPTTPTGSRTSSARLPSWETCGSSHGKVSASLAWARTAPASLERLQSRSVFYCPSGCGQGAGRTRSMSSVDRAPTPPAADHRYQRIDRGS
jgi:hypothetical protein